jgi:TolA-binding protein
MAKMTLDKLGNMVATGFAEIVEISSKLTDQVAGIDQKTNDMQDNIEIMQKDIVVMQKDMSRLTFGQEDIIMRLDSKANKIDLPKDRLRKK